MLNKKIAKSILLVGLVLVCVLAFSPKARAITASELQQQIALLLAQIKQLQQQLAQIQGNEGVAWCHTFNANLRIGDKNKEVISLHQVLEKEGYGPFERGGDDISVFDEFSEQAASAVVEFQEKYASEILAPYRLKRGTGFVGVSTRAKLNKLYGCGQENVVAPMAGSTGNNPIPMPSNPQIPLPPGYTGNVVSSDGGVASSSPSSDIPAQSVPGSPGGGTGVNVTVACPYGYIKVPGNKTYSTNDFCVMQYEAKNVFDFPLGVSFYTPWVSVTQTEADTLCKKVKGHLITNNEWMTIARNVEQVASNWSSGVVGSGCVFQGNNGTNDTCSYDGNDPEQTSIPAVRERNSKAKLTLSNGNTIWDLAGNVWEWTSDSISCAEQQCNISEMPYDATPASESVEFDKIRTYGKLSYNQIRPSNPAWTSVQGMGRLYTDYDEASPSGSGNIHALVRGGGWYSLPWIPAYSGIFELNLEGSPLNPSTGTGFRCVLD